MADKEIVPIHAEPLIVPKVREDFMKIPRIYHENGNWIDYDGGCFDFIFTDLLRDPTLPPHVFPCIMDLQMYAYANVAMRRRNNTRSMTSAFNELRGF